MSKRSRTLKKAHREQQPVTKVRTPADTIAMIPYLFGFMPQESIVVVSLQGPRKRFGPCFRLDLAPAGGAADEADYVSGLIRHHRFSAVLLVAFSERPEVADPVVTEIIQRLGARSVTVVDALRADGSMWWSYVCTDPTCCSPAGTPYDVRSSRVAAEAVLAGMQQAPDRDALREQFRPISAQRQREVRAAVAQLRSTAGVGRLRQPGAVEEVIGGCLKDPSELSVDTIASLAAAVQDISVRDRAWAMMRRSNADQHFLLWRSVMRSVPDELLAPVGSLTAFAAWLSGHGVLASHATERVEEVAPAYGMIQVMRDALANAVNPAAWERLMSG